MKCQSFTTNNAKCEKEATVKIWLTPTQKKKDPTPLMYLCDEHLEWRKHHNRKLVVEPLNANQQKAKE